MAMERVDRNSKVTVINWAMVGPVLQALLLVVAMVAGFTSLSEGQRNQASQIGVLDSKVEKLYDLLVYPAVGQTKL